MKRRRVRLRNRAELTGTGYVWEYLLMEAGWNELPEDKKYGLADETMVVEFPHCGNIPIG